MSLSGYAYKTVNCHISAISFINKLYNLTDNTQCFLVRKLLDGMNRSQRRRDTRQPVTINLLHLLVHNLKFVCLSHYESILFTAAFMVAFYALLRVSEINIISKEDVYLSDSHLCLNIRHSKTDQLHRGSIVKIPLDRNLSGHLKEVILHYMAVRPTSGYQFLSHLDGSPLTPYQFRSVLAKTLKYSGIDCSRLKSHSFRIGGATYWIMQGFSEDEVKKMGRWSSNSYKLYVRP